MKQIAPYLFFKDNCREAMEFYKDCLGYELWIQTVGESPMTEQMPKEMHGLVIHAALMKGEEPVFMASDTMEGETKLGNSVSLCIICDTSEEIKDLYTKLSDGGNQDHPLREEFFGTFGSLTDKYGVQWMLQFDNSK
jgi:PhnB protein